MSFVGKWKREGEIWNCPSSPFYFNQSWWWKCLFKSFEMFRCPKIVEFKFCALFMFLFPFKWTIIWREHKRVVVSPPCARSFIWLRKLKACVYDGDFSFPFPSSLPINTKRNIPPDLFILRADIMCVWSGGLDRRSRSEEGLRSWWGRRV